LYANRRRPEVHTDELTDVIINYLSQFFARVPDKFNFRMLATEMLACSKSRNRKSRATPHAAWLKPGDDRAPVCCVLWDISDEGARLTTARNICDLPDKFSLAFNEGGKRNC
jgi:hypothetical protein